MEKRQGTILTRHSKTRLIFLAGADQPDIPGIEEFGRTFYESSAEWADKIITTLENKEKQTR
jgi:hypothetical protein